MQKDGTIGRETRGKGYGQGMSVRSREQTEERKNFISFILERKSK